MSSEQANEHSSIGQRTLTALIGLPIMVLVIWCGGWIFFSVLLLVLIFMTLELRRLLYAAGYRPYIWLSFSLSVLFMVSSMFPQQRLLLLEIGLGLAMLVSFPLFFVRTIESWPLTDWGITLALALYYGWPLSCLLMLRGNEPGHFLSMDTLLKTMPRGVWWVLLVFLSVWGFDFGAFIVGHWIGRHPIAPRISPGKNWEGLSGGIVVSVIICLLLMLNLLHLPWYFAILLGIILGCTAMGGDLSESLFKRQARVKDSGNIIPGHGGILDRADSILFGPVVIYVFMLLVGR